MKLLIRASIFVLVILNPITSKSILFNNAFALPPPEDTPEEILRTEIILEGRSPIDGKPLSAREYETLKAELAESSIETKLNPDIQQLILLLQVRKFLKTVIPFY